MLLSLDGFSAYLDLATTPEDMVAWLAQLAGDDRRPERRAARPQRELLQSAGELHARRGTRRGLELAVAGRARRTRPGGGDRRRRLVEPSPAATCPATRCPAVVVVARPQAGQDVEVERLDALVRAIKPAHVQHRVQVAPE